MIRGKLLGTLFLLFGCYTAWGNISFWRQVKEITKNGAEGTAIAPDTYSYSCRSGRRSWSSSLGLTASCSLTLSYVDADGQEQAAGSYETYKATIEKLKRGETVHVKYLPSDPKKAFIVGDASMSRMGMRWFLSIGVILLGVYGLFFEEKSEKVF